MFVGKHSHWCEHNVQVVACTRCEAADRARVAALLAFWSDIEARSADAHAVYQREAHRRGDVRHPDAYGDLSEATKEWDRVLVRWVLAETKRLLDGDVREGDGR